MQRHYISTKLEKEYGKSTRVNWSIEQPKNVIIFVHGFAGSSDTTWQKFPLLLPMTAETARSDLIFYGYDGISKQANNSAIIFFEFLNSLLHDPTKLINNTLPKGARKRDPNFSYERVIIVAHSLGAVIVRLALLRAHAFHFDHNRTIPWLDRIRLVLFAPAHKGANASYLLRELFSSGNWFLGIAGCCVRYRIPLIDELDPGSTVITDLTRRTSKALSKGRHTLSSNHLIASEVIWAEKEKVVKNIPFCDDPPADLFRDRTHKDVCKPDTLNDRAIQAVISVLRRGANGRKKN